MQNTSAGVVTAGGRTVESEQHTTDPVEQLSAALRQLSRILEVARAAQWMKAPSAGVPSERQRGEGGRPADPTADVALDSRRLALREAVTRAESTAALYTAALTSHTEKICVALHEWQGRSSEGHTDS